ncbi:MAG: alpha/beta fold hydrolase [Acidimicrobiales bacterium]
MTTFGLVHGAWHRASSWRPLVDALEANGHRSVAVDLPCDDPAATFETYAEVVVRSLEGQEGDLVLVGHSLAGHTIPLVAARVPVRHLIFLCALIAEPGRSFVDQLTAEPDMLLPQYEAGLSEPDDRRLRHWADRRLAIEVLYGDCDPADAERAVDDLRPQALGPYTVPCPLDALPPAERTYVLCTEDRLVNPEWSRRAASVRLGVQAVELPGSHSPFISRPDDLARLLEKFA